MSCTERVIVLVDMDCFYCQVEEKLDPNLEGKPIAVVQYNAWRGGGIIAVNYPAREKGVTRHMRGYDAKEKCPEIMLVRVPEVRGKADLAKYREAGKKVAEVLHTFTPVLERASVDEAYLDITEVVKRRILTDAEQIHPDNLKNTYVVGYDLSNFLYNVVKHKDFLESNYRLAMGGLVAEEIRAKIYEKTGYKCSAGIAHNKILAKLVCGLHKPNKQTILPHECVSELYKDLSIKKVTGLGGKFGVSLSEQLKISKMGELIGFSEKQLTKHFEEKTAKWLYNIARGVDHEPVTPRLISKSIGCCKKFPGRTALVTLESVEHWVNELTSELSERLAKDIEENNRKSKQITLHFAQFINNKDISNSRSLLLSSYDQPKIAQVCLEAIKKFCVKPDGTYNITYLGFSVGKFEENKKVGNISRLFEKMKSSGFKKDLQNILQTDNNVQDVLPETMEHKNFFENNLNDSKSSGEDETYNADTASIYSAETDELNEDPKSLIYYEDIYPENVVSEPIFSKPPNISDYPVNKYIKNDIAESSSNLFSEQTPQSSSFFSKYFENYSTDNSCTSSPVERNFDTSKILEEEFEYSNDNVEPCASIQDSRNEEPNNSKMNGQVSNSETCPDCKKNIPISEFGSHMDYHYALNIVKEEAHLYKPSPSNISKSPVKEKFSGSPKPNTKNKIEKTKPIRKYLQTEVLSEEDSELCSECNKRIKLDDVINHMDYHTAKKLHLEINAKPSVKQRENVEKICVKAKNKKQNSFKKMGSILSYLNKS